jgi:type IV secretion system protein VirB10
MPIDPMSPVTSPDSTPLFGGRRPNNVPIYIIGVIIALFLVVMTSVAVGRSANAMQSANPRMEHQASSADPLAIARELVGEQPTGLVPAHGIPNFGDEDTPPIPIARVDFAQQSVGGDLPSDAGHNKGLGGGGGGGPSAATPMPAQDVNDANDPRMQAVAAAAASKTTVQGANAPGRQPGSNAGISSAELQNMRRGSSDPNAAFAERLRMAKEAFGGGQAFANLGNGGGNVQLAAADGSASSGGYDQFAKTSKEDRWKLDAQPEAPRTGFELRAGSLIPAVLVSGINSDIPGAILAQVSQSVYDTATGHHLLIPQGSRLFGTYDNGVIHGQERLLVAWQRIVFPDGKALDIGAMPGSDSVGYAGFQDKVNHHYARIFGSALLMSLITAGVDMSQDDTGRTGDARNASSALSEALGQQLGQAASQLIMKNLNIAPTIEIRPGFVFNVVATKDISMKQPYHSFDYAQDKEQEQ